MPIGIEEELGVRFKHLVAMAEDRYSDYAVGKAIVELVEAAVGIVNGATPISAAEKKDRAAEVGRAIENKLSRSSLNANRTVESNYKP